MANINEFESQISLAGIGQQRQVNWFRFFTLVLLLFGFIFPASAQLNLNVGYNGAYLENKPIEDILHRYNERNTWLSQDFETGHLMGGIVAGARYKFGIMSFLLQWTNKRNAIEASGIDPITDEEAFKQLLFRYNSYSAGMEFFINAFSFGGTMDYSHYSIQTEETGVDTKNTFLATYGWSSHFFISFRLTKADNLSIALQPYLHWPWSDINLFKLEKELNPDFATGNLPSDYREHFKNIGISLIFYNGEQ